MHKFTIFTIILSAVVIITVGELVVNDYLDSESQVPSTQSQVSEESISEEVAEEIEVEEVAPVTFLSGLDYESFGFSEGVELRSKDFSSVFSFLEYESQASEPYYWEILEGEEYVGGLYEIVCENPTEAFTIYTDLRESGVAQPESGSVNEVNMYGEASFYFNHSVKTTTVHLVILGESRVYGLTYAHKDHGKFKGIFGVLK
ncbi:MAG: hypothetical protein ABII07_01730 [Patescibacteria group bacterium]|nr:hypothetical protein [Patescibacteria group bacterium]